MKDYSAYCGKSRPQLVIEHDLLTDEVQALKAENDALRRIMRTAAGKLRSHAIAQPDRAWEKMHDALGLLEYANRSPENPS